MTEEVALWKQHILERKANGQTVTGWCKEHNVTKGSYNYWRRQVMLAEGSAPKHTVNTKPDTGQVIFAQLDRTQPTQSALQVTWKDVTIHLSSSQEAPLSGRADCLSAPHMLNLFMTGAERIFLACGATDFRKQADSLAAIVNMQFHLDPFADPCVFIFCNRKQNGIKILRYDSNGFILASKKLLDGMKFQWPKTPEEVKVISYQQAEWLFQGLKTL